MGCDIHNIFEYKTDDGTWKAIYIPKSKMLKADEERFAWAKEDCKDQGKPPPKGALLSYSGRNYNLFAILADVRNGYGFAGVSTGKGFEPLAPNRGIPEDASPEAKELSESWGIDGHSHTWISLKEILDTGWQKKVTTLYGVIRYDEYLVWKQRCADAGAAVAPESNCGGVFGTELRTVTMDVADGLVDLTPEDAEKTYVRVAWQVMYANCVLNFMEFAYSRVGSLGYDPERVRMVMLFDN